MKLVRARIRNYKNIIDSGSFTLEDVTCLVGRNQSGKSALLQALYRLNPVDDQRFRFDYVRDYPKRSVADYMRRTSAGEISDYVVTATFRLDHSDISAVENLLGHGSFPSDTVELTVHVDYNNTLHIEPLPIDENIVIDHFIDDIELFEQTVETLQDVNSLHELATLIEDKMNSEDAPELISDYDKLRTVVEQFRSLDVSQFAWSSILADRLPRFVFYDQYAFMSGHADIAALKGRRDSDELSSQDLPLLGLMLLGGLDIDSLIDDSRSSEVLTNELESASQAIASRVQRYWKVGPDFRPRLSVDVPTDADGLETTGTRVISIRIEDVYDDGGSGFTTPIDQRSAGFNWLFSFVALIEYLKSLYPHSVILLDEPGTSLHGTAQAELLSLIRDEANSDRSFIYTTHSPFMVDVDGLDSVRILDSNSPEDGVRVTDDVYRVRSGDFLPLQSAFGYSAFRQLLIGPNVLIVEGVSDMVFIEKMRSVLTQLDRMTLDDQWTLVPAGGIGTIPTLVSFLRSKEEVNVAVLCDGSSEPGSRLNKAVGERLINEVKVVYVADCIGRRYGDIEDLFREETYLKLVNRHFGTSVSVQDLPQGGDRIIERLRRLGNDMLPGVSADAFHFECARIFLLEYESVVGQLDDSELSRWEGLFERFNLLLDQ